MSLYITAIRLTNWICYRGEHQIDLGPGAHALVAERDGDPRRSNAQGKSAFLWSIRFALTGDHPERTEDEWLTDGEREGGVDLELSDGTFISRWRTRGDATRLKVVASNVKGIGEERELLNAVAQEYVNRVVGFSKEEQLSTWWCGQGQADLFVNGDPGEATKDVVRWCGVEPVRRAAKRVAEELAGLLKGDARLLAVLDDANAEMAKLQAELPPDWDAWEKPRLDSLEGLRVINQANATELERRRERERIEREAKQWKTLEEERVRLEQVPPAPTESAIEVARQAMRTANAAEHDGTTALRSYEELARGEFSGLCPLAGIQCPAKDEINQDGERSRAKVVEAKKRLKVLKDDYAEKNNVAAKLDEQVQSRAYADRRLAEIAPELVRLRPSHDAAALLFKQGSLDVNQDDAIRQGERELEAMRDKRSRYRAADKRRHDAVMAREALAPDIIARREALQILGPSGAQRRLVEGFLSQSERRAAEDLSAAGVDLRVSFSWQRELEGPADVCSTCGQPFPSSRKVKACEGCGATRGRKIEQKLRCEVKPKSGGMDAIAGVGVRLSQFAWLKVRRSSAWGVACLDEPLAAVDAHHRALVGRHLAAMLGGRYGVEQAFVSAHDPGLLGALPRRVVVKGSERGSTIEVR